MPGQAVCGPVAVEHAMEVVAEKLKQVVPDAFEGDGVAYMQSVYRDPAFSMELRLDAAAKAARFERPTLAAIAMQQPPRARLDVSALNAVEQGQLLGLLRKAMGSARELQRSMGKSYVTNETLLSQQILETCTAHAKPTRSRPFAKCTLVPRSHACWNLLRQRLIPNFGAKQPRY